MPSKQRIAFVANTSWSVYKFRLFLLQEFALKGFDVYVLAPRDKYSNFFEHIEGVQFIELKKLKSKSISIFDDLHLYTELKDIYKRIQPHLIFHYTIKPNIYGSLAAANANCPAISVITGLGYTFTAKRFLKFIACQLYRYALKKTREVWFLNHDDQKIFIEEKLVAAGKTFLLPGEGVDSNIFYPVDFKMNKRPVVYLLIGRMIEHKGVYEYAMAAKALLAKGMVAKFRLLGFFDDKSAVAISREQLLQWQSEGSIEYLGATDDVVPFIAQADCIVLPSYREGLPLSLLEGSSMCKAIVASDVAGCRDIVKNSINGFLCKEKNADDLAEKMEGYYNLPDEQKKEMGLAGREIVLKYFNRDIIAKIYMDKIEQFINKGSE